MRGTASAAAQRRIDVECTCMFDAYPNPAQYTLITDSLAQLPRETLEIYSKIWPSGSAPVDRHGPYRTSASRTGMLVMVDAISRLRYAPSPPVVIFGWSL